MPDLRPDKMKLGAFFHPTGNHIAAWLYPGSQIDAGINFEYYAPLAATAETAKFDLMFLADAVATASGGSARCGASRKPRSPTRWSAGSTAMAPTDS